MNTFKIVTFTELLQAKAFITESLNALRNGDGGMIPQRHWDEAKALRERLEIVNIFILGSIDTLIISVNERH